MNGLMCRNAKLRRTGRVGFTLIELFIVVAIIGVIAAFVLPRVLARFTRGKDAGPEAAEASAEAPGKPGKPGRPEEQLPQGTVPGLDSGVVSVDLTARYRLHGMNVHTEVQAAVKGEYVFRIERPGEKYLFEFRFPPGAAEARDASLSVEAAPGRLVEPNDVHYSGSGIRWVGALTRPMPFRIRVSYVSKGRDRFVLPIPGRGRVRQLKVTLRAEKASQEWIPPDGLQPTSSAPGQMVWDLSNVVTDRDIVVEVPAALSPLGRAILLCKLTGLAVFLFGACFWYLSELHKPDSLDSFRWGHFLLLAVTYSLFFVVFTVLAFESESDPWWRLGIAAAVSLPLLVLHVSRFMAVKFALLYALPLAVFTSGIAVNGVYGGPFRSYIFIAAGVVAVAFLTVTYRPWSAGREAREKELVAERWRAMAENREAADVASALLARANRLPSAHGADEGDLERRKLKEGRRVLTELLDRRKKLGNEEKSLDAATDEFAGERRRRNVGIRRRSEELTVLLKKQVDGFAPVVDALEKEHAENEKRARELAEKEKEEARKRPEERCVACGEPGASSPYCPHCGTPRPVAIKCPKCGSTAELPVHLMARAERPLSGALHCVRCGAAHKETPLEIARRLGLPVSREAEAT